MRTCEKYAEFIIPFYEIEKFQLKQLNISLGLLYERSIQIYFSAIYQSIINKAIASLSGRSQEQDALEKRKRSLHKFSTI